MLAVWLGLVIRVVDIVDVEDVVDEKDGISSALLLEAS